MNVAHFSRTKKVLSLPLYHCLTDDIAKNNSVWLRICLDDAYIPIPLSMNVDDSKINIDTYEVIFYEQPNPKRLQFLALNPLELDISTTDISKNTDPQTEDLKNMQSIIDYGHKMNGETECVSDELDIMLVQVGDRKR
jgi:phosphatidylinositol glycan class Q protein